jgi:hypothetical protein
LETVQPYSFPSVISVVTEYNANGARSQGENTRIPTLTSEQRPGFPVDPEIILPERAESCGDFLKSCRSFFKSWGGFLKSCPSF